MTEERTASVTVFVDPQCPFAWITAQWLLEVARHTALDVVVELMSLACVNEGRDLDDWYRQYNDDAWAAARVAAALLDSSQAATWPRFYETYGHRRHIEGLRDNPANLAKTIAELGLPAGLLDAAGDSSWDDGLRAYRRSTGRSGRRRDTDVASSWACIFSGRSLPRSLGDTRRWSSGEQQTRSPGLSGSVR
jgi:hypothetical protein